MQDLLHRCIAGALLAAALPVAAGAVGEVPDALRPPAGQKLHLTLYARGSQIYRCEADPADAARSRWAFVAPDADLFEDDKLTRLAGHHAAGPSWQGVDGSRVTGKVHANAPAPVAGAVAWLLLDASADQRPGMFAGVTSIQRIDTRGGQAGDAACGPAQYGMQLRAPYTATYRFFAGAHAGP